MTNRSFMKVFFITVTCLMVFSCGLVVHGQAPADQESKEQNDSTSSVIAWFLKSDTVTYEIIESAWKR